jgi:hypothetical protein
VLLAFIAAWLPLGCSRNEDAPAPSPSVAVPRPVSPDELLVVPPASRPLRAETPATFRFEARPPLPANLPCEWIFESPGRRWTVTSRGPSLDYALPSGDTFKIQVRVGSTVSKPLEVQAYRVALIDAEDRPIREGRLANLSSNAFDSMSRLRESAVAASPDRVRILVEDPSADAPASVGVSARPSGPSTTLPLTGSPARRMSRPFLLLGDAEDAAAGASGLYVVPGGRVEMEYRGAPAGGVKVGPGVIHEIPVRFVVVGPGLPPTPDIEKAVDLRLAQANAVWEPFGRRFKRAPVSRVERFGGLLLIRGRSAGVDERGHPSRTGALVDGREVSVPGIWRDDGAPMTPKAAARAWITRAGKAFQVDLFEDLLAGDREAILLRVRRRDGTPAAVERLADWNDVAQAGTPLGDSPPDGIEVAAAATLLSLQEAALLGSAKGSRSEGLDFFIVTALRSMKDRPSFKVYPDGIFPYELAGSAIVSWAILERTGRYPYGLARVAGEMLLPPGVAPEAEDTLFSDPLSEGPGVGSHKRLSSATGLKITERGRGLSGRK